MTNLRGRVQRQKSGLGCNHSIHGIVSLRSLAWNHRCTRSTRGWLPPIVVIDFKGGLEPESAVSTEAPVDTAAWQHDAGDLATELLFKGWAPGHELEAQAIIDHSEPA